MTTEKLRQHTISEAEKMGHQLTATIELVRVVQWDCDDRSKQLASELFDYATALSKGLVELVGEIDEGLKVVAA